MKASRVFLGTAASAFAACALLSAAFLGACDDTNTYPIPPLHESGAPLDAFQADTYRGEAGGEGGDAASDAPVDAASDGLEDASVDGPAVDGSADAPEDVADG